MGLDWLSASYTLSLSCHRAAGVKGTIAEFTAAMQQLSLMLSMDHKFLTQTVQVSFLTKLKKMPCNSRCASAIAH